MPSKRVLFIAEDGFEDLELFYPMYRLMEAGADVVVASSSRRSLEGKHGYTVEAGLSYDEVEPGNYAMLVVPGGKSPERVRLHREGVDIVRWFVEQNRPIGVICHGVQLLISAGAVKGKKIACWYGVKDDLVAAGGEFVDGVAVDGNIISARHPGDLPEWGRLLVERLSKPRDG